MQAERKTTVDLFLPVAEWLQFEVFEPAERKLGRLRPLMWTVYVPTIILAGLAYIMVAIARRFVA